MAKKSGKDLDVLPRIAELLLETARNQREIVQQLMRADTNVVSVIAQDMSTQARERAKKCPDPEADPASEDDTLYCSFCGKNQHEVKKLVAGQQVFICDECIVLCMDIIREEPTADPSDD